MSLPALKPTHNDVISAMDAASLRSLKPVAKPHTTLAELARIDGRLRMLNALRTKTIERGDLVQAIDLSRQIDLALSERFDLMRQEQAA